VMNSAPHVSSNRQSGHPTGSAVRFGRVTYHGAGRASDVRFGS
jgi:hypothetical protein